MHNDMFLHKSSPSPTTKKLVRQIVEIKTDKIVMLVAVLFAISWSGWEGKKNYRKVQHVSRLTWPSFLFFFIWFFLFYLPCFMTCKSFGLDYIHCVFSWQRHVWWPYRMGSFFKWTKANLLFLSLTFFLSTLVTWLLWAEY